MKHPCIEKAEAAASEGESLNPCYISFICSWCYYSSGQSVARTTQCLRNCRTLNCLLIQGHPSHNVQLQVSVGHTCKPHPGPQLQPEHSYRPTSRYCTRLGDFPDFCSRVT